MKSMAALTQIIRDDCLTKGGFNKVFAVPDDPDIHR